MAKKRLSEIDVVRGLAILGMILVHATSYFLTEAAAFTVWDASQFAVVAFVFCSSYLFFQKDSSLSGSSLLMRFKRLLVPYYYYLVIMTLLIMLKEKSLPTPEGFVRLATLTTETNDPSWLVLLFIELTLAMFLMKYLLRQSKGVLYIFAFASLASSIAFLSFAPTLNYKLIMWLPWSMVAFAAWKLVKFEKNKHYLCFFTLGWALVFGALWIVLSKQGHQLAQYDNKYPPNLFHLAYGLAGTGLFMVFAREGLFDRLKLTNFLSFLSRHSYSIYFIHFLVIYVCLNFFRSFVFHIGWGEYFLIVLGTTLAIQLALNRMRGV